MSNTKQADSEIHEDQLLNFLVNSLDEEVALTLAENAELDAEDIYEVLVGACADGTSVSTLCERSEDGCLVGIDDCDSSSWPASRSRTVDLSTDFAGTKYHYPYHDRPL